MYTVASPAIIEGLRRFSEKIRRIKKVIEGFFLRKILPKMAYYFRVPANLNIEQLVRNNLIESVTDGKKAVQMFYYLCGLVSQFKARHGGWEENNRGFVPLSSDYMRKIHQRYSYYLAWLVNVGVLESDNHFITGSKCRGYKFTSAYRGMPSKEVVVDDMILCKNIKKLYRDIEAKKQKELRPYWHVVRWFTDGGLRIDKCTAMGWVEKFWQIESTKIMSGDHTATIKRENTATRSEEERLKDLAEVCNSIKLFIDKIHSKSLSVADFSVCSFGNRLHGVFTYTMKELRNFITYNGIPLVAVDIKNSQPYFSTLLLEPAFWKSKKSKTNRLQLSKVAPDIYAVLRQDKLLYNTITLLDSSEILARRDVSTGRYKNLAISGRLYEFLQEQFLQKLSAPFLRKYGHLLNERLQVKQEVLRVLYCENEVVDRPFYEPCRVFNRLFPQVAKLFSAIKSNKHLIGDKIRLNKTLAAILQRIESYVVLKVVCKRIARERPDLPIFTIHDSVVTTVGNEEYVKNVIAEELTKLVGIAPQVAYEYWMAENAEEALQNENNSYIWTDKQKITICDEVVL